MIDQTTGTETVTPTEGFPPCSSGQAADAARNSPPVFFSARLAGARVLAHGALSRTGPTTTLRGLVVRGRLHGMVIGLRGLGRFDDARFVAALTLAMNSVRHAITTQGVALATFPGAQLCLGLSVTRHGRHLPIGGFRVLGATGAAARLSGEGKFAFLLGPTGGHLAGRLHLTGAPRTGSRGSGLPAACRSLQRLTRGGLQ